MLRVLRILRILDSMNQLLQPQLQLQLQPQLQPQPLDNAELSLPQQEETIQTMEEEEPPALFEIRTWYISRTPDGPDGINQHIYYNILGDQDQNNLYYVTINEQPRQKLYNIVVRLIDENTRHSAFGSEDCCPICYESMLSEKTVTLNCCHVFCGTCIESCLTKGVDYHHHKPLCAICRTEMKTFSVNSQDLYETLNKYCKCY